MVTAPPSDQVGTARTRSGVERITIFDGPAAIEIDESDPTGALAKIAQTWIDDGCEVTIVVRRGERVPISDLGGSDLSTTVATLHASEAHDALAEVLASTHWSRLDALGMSDLRAILAALPAGTLARYPLILVSAAQFAESDQRSVDIRSKWLAAADSITGADDPVRPRLEVELARDLIRDLDVDRGRELAERVLRGARVGDGAARGRAVHTLAKVDMWEGDRDALLRAENQLREAISAFRLDGEKQWEASAWLELGWVYNFNGAFDQSIDAIARAVHLLGAATSQRSSTLTFYADVLVEVGRYEDATAALREAETIARSMIDHAGLAYAAWGFARLRSRQRDHGGTLASLREVELHRTDWYRRPAGAAFHGEAAEMLVHLNDPAGALEHLSRAERLDAHHHTITDVPRAMYEARFGDPQRAGELLDSLLADPATWERNRWRYLMYAAWAAHRVGDDARAGDLAKAATRAVEALGRPSLISIGEPELHAHFFGSSTTSDERWTVSVFGEFEVRRNGVSIRVPPGGAAWLIEYLAVFGVRTVDEVADRLWPDADESTARRRLRNLLNRVRSDCGGLIERIDARLRLSPSAEVDLAEFRRDVTAVAAAPIAERSGLARLALARASGELLADVHDDGFAVVRERVRRQIVDLLDLVASDALDRADQSEATRLLEQTIMLEPHEESRYATLAQLLIDLGRPRSAQDVVSRWLAMATDLDVAPSSAMTSLANRLDALT